LISLGYEYLRAEYALREFDRFLVKYALRNRCWRFDQSVLAWLSSKPQRKAVSVSGDATVLRQLSIYLRRLPGRKRFPEPLWPRLPTESCFVPYFLSELDIDRLLALCADLKRPPFRGRSLQSFAASPLLYRASFRRGLASSLARCRYPLWRSFCRNIQGKSQMGSVSPIVVQRTESIPYRPDDPHTHRTG
jgi:hypothetical protein